MKAINCDRIKSIAKHIFFKQNFVVWLSFCFFFSQNGIGEDWIKMGILKKRTNLRIFSLPMGGV